ncbi:SusC/RagA family TonB-linked outer membrane protein [Sphingobacterium hotanense]|uniref:SusC/RagA family TonB-linked outer membrane protein n=1 Tax=Sphingobacterium hotanense TaxID=649196 RepID=UPI0021A80D6B|nr:SusC/RagA family TonB-linked outer membrane protein [Sphingobacterium hotanense]MCT1525042.1 SusC/RagA family TonB-linked outer membrane protein [Sphingobacterium hotanense]
MVIFPFICLSVIAQEKRVFGIVVDSLSLTPINEVTVNYSGKQQKTGKDGQFIIEKRGSAKSVTLTHVNYRTSAFDLPAVDTTITVYMAPIALSIEEVVVSTGYQTFDQKTSTGSFIQVSGEEIGGLPQEDFISRLDGLASGTLLNRPANGNGQNTMFTVRGLGTLGSVAMGRPLIVLDGFPYEGDPNAINPNDIENVTILKDAAASAIWGVRAGNGVVVITTKSGVKGQPVKIGTTNLVTVTDRPNITYIPRITSSDYIDMEQFLFDRGRYTAVLNNQTNRPAVTPVIEMLYQHQQGNLTDQQLESAIDAMRSRDIYGQLGEYVYRPMVRYQTSANMTWSGDNSSNYLSVGYDRNSTVLRRNASDRFTLRNQFETNLLPGLRLAAALQLAGLGSSSNNTGMDMLNSTISMYPYAEIADADGNPLAIPYQYRYAFVDTLHRGLLHDWTYRPIEELNLADNTSNGYELNSTFDVSYKLLPSLHLSAKYQYARQDHSSANIYSRNTYYARDLINRYSSISGRNVEYVIPNSGIKDQYNNVSQSHSFRFQVDIDQSIGSFVKLRGIIGNESRTVDVNGNNSRIYGYERNSNSIAVLDYVSTYPIIANLSGASRIPFSDNLTGTRSRFLSFYLNTDVSVLDRYSVSFSARRDASNLFGVRTSQRWNPLWSAGFAWSLDREGWEQLSALDLLRLRMTYGRSGNVNPALAGRTVIEYNSGRSTVNALRYAIVRNPPDEDLRWETVATSNIGVDFRLKKTGLSGSIETYVKESYDLFAPVTADPTIGFSTLTKNSATMRNVGLEINMNIPYRAGGFHLRTALNNTWNRSEVREYFFERLTDTEVITANTVLQPVESYPAYSIFAYRWAGLNPENGDPQGFLEGETSSDYNAIRQDSKVDDLRFMGSSVPVMFGGLTQEVHYGKLDMSFLITWRLGHVFRAPTVNYSGMVLSGAMLHSDYYGRWQEPGDELSTDIPSFAYPANSARDQFFQNSEVNVDRADVVRWQNLRIGYRPFAGKGSLGSLRINFMVSNLGILWKATDRNLDPDYSIMPPSRSYSLGLNLNL